MIRLIHGHEHLMKIFFNIIFSIVSAAYVPVLMLSGKWDRLMVMRLGRLPPDVAGELSAPKNVWVHAVSVGEVQVVTGLIKGLQQRFPKDRVVLTVVTRTGFHLARKKAPRGTCVLYAPLDLTWVVRRYLEAIKPRLYITAETELWPNLFVMLKESGVPVFVVNGRISDRSFARYRQLTYFLSPLLASVRHFCMQSEADAERIRDLGAPAEKVSVMGNMKFDMPPEEGRLRRQDCGYEARHLIWLAGSTHPGEEEILLRIYKGLRSRFPDLRFVLAPRHIERVESVSRCIKEYGFQPVCYSRLRRPRLQAQDVLLIDTIGHLRALYGLSDIVFVGKSLVGQGGQNIIEPAFYGKPVIIGPHMENFRQITEIFLKHKAVIQVQNEFDLRRKMGALCRDSRLRVQLGERIRHAAQENRGATDRTLQTILQEAV